MKRRDFYPRRGGGLRSALGQCGSNSPTKYRMKRSSFWIDFKGELVLLLVFFFAVSEIG